MPKDPVPTKYRGFVEKARKGSRSAAIRLHCLECMGYSSIDVRVCTAPDCALYPYRLGKFQAPEGVEKRKKRKFPKFMKKKEVE